MNQITEIYADQIIDPIDPMRTDIDREKIYELAESIKREGLINPITVRPYQGKYEVVAGHRRFMACKIAGIVKIPCVVKELTDEQTVEIRAHENLFREDLDPVEEALIIAKLVGEDESKIPDIAKRMNKSEQWVEDRLEILTYPDYLIAAIKEGKIKLGVAKWLGRIQDDVYRKMFVDQAVANGMAIWQAEYYYRQWEAGIFKESSEILPPEKPEHSADKPKVRAVCARCGKIAEEPNLQSVFIHIECPPDD